MRRTLHKVEFLRTGDAAAAYGIAGRACALVVNLVTILLLADYLSIEAQGYFYTFRSLLTVQVFFELGLTTSLSAFFSHEFAHVKWGPQGTIIGDDGHRDRCLKIYRQAVVLFRYLSGGFVVVVWPLGYWFFQSKPAAGVAWQVPWLVSVLATAAFLYFTPHLALVMGSGEVAAVYRVWMWGAVIGGVLAWVLLVSGNGLYAVAGPSLGNAAFAVWYLRLRKKCLLRPVVSSSEGGFSWRRELWPMQWRLALSWISGYFIYSLFTPILFQYHGSAVAGQMGMTLNASNALLGVCVIIVSMQMPRMGRLIALQQYGDLDRLYRIATAVAVGTAVAGLVSATFLVERLQAHGWYLGSRVLPWQACGLIFASVVITVYINAAAIYLRAHKSEPLMWQSLAAAVVQGSVTWWTGVRYGATGEVLGFFLTNALFALPVIYFSHRYYRQAWHKSVLPAAGGEEAVASV